MALNKKFKIPIICGWIFSIILLIMSFSAFLDYNNFTILENTVTQGETEEKRDTRENFLHKFREKKKLNINHKMATYQAFTV